MLGRISKLYSSQTILAQKGRRAYKHEASQGRGCLRGPVMVAIEELEYILKEVKTHPLPDDPTPIKTMAGGSVANTIRGLTTGFGISSGIIGAYGDDEQGQLFVNNMSSNGVNISRLRKKKGHTAQCVCLVDELGNRTMRPCLSNAVKVQAEELKREDFKGSKVDLLNSKDILDMQSTHKGLGRLNYPSCPFYQNTLLNEGWLVMRYAKLNLEVIQAAIDLAKQEGLLVSLDLASFEMVRNFKLPLLKLLESGNIDLCFANEDEATELLRGEQNSDPAAAVEFLAKYCQWAVVTLGANGCIAKHGKEIVRVPAIGEAKAIDATGAGDLFASGFLYGVIKGLSLEECCKVGACSGGAVIRSLGGEVTLENWQWMTKQMQIKGLPTPSPDVSK
ncbi:uncharacterized protein LOC129301616 isoform X2 [Prosopis cineraria]|uniref:uncharacterized protein LOC129301616 isoform X2 n=1 Tax=Prosopis cineraria TaxID=364024 RepID=UPI00240F575C|nr:uncharacterized protein LOC129301616 isoform X2 [Prosopis cineraria]